MISIFVHIEWKAHTCTLAAVHWSLARAHYHSKSSGFGAFVSDMQSVFYEWRVLSKIFDFKIFTLIRVSMSVRTKNLSSKQLFVWKRTNCVASQCIHVVPGLKYNNLTFDLRRCIFLYERLSFVRMNQVRSECNSISSHSREQRKKMWISEIINLEPSGCGIPKKKLIKKRWV